MLDHERKERRLLIDEAAGRVGPTVSLSCSTLRQLIEEDVDWNEDAAIRKYWSQMTKMMSARRARAKPCVRR